MVYLDDHKHKKKKAVYHTVDEICATFTKRSANKINLASLFEKYLERKCFDKDSDYITFKDFQQIKFKCPSDINVEYFYTADELKEQVCYTPYIPISHPLYA